MEMKHKTFSDFFIGMQHYSKNYSTSMTKICQEFQETGELVFLSQVPHPLVTLANTYEKKDFPSGSVVKNLPANTGDSRDMGSIPGSGRSPGAANGNPLEYSCLENPTDRGAWQAKIQNRT